MLRNGCWKILAVSSIDFESTNGWDVIDELADDFVEVRCARVQATLCRAEETRTAEFQNHSAQDDVPQVQYRCKARYAKHAKGRCCSLVKEPDKAKPCRALASCMALLPTPGTAFFLSQLLLCDRDKADTYRLIREHLSAQGWMETSRAKSELLQAELCSWLLSERELA